MGYKTFHFAKKLTWVLAAALVAFISSSYAETSVSVPYAVLAGGINQSNFQSCISLLTSRCTRKSRNLPYPIYPADCLNKYLRQPFCLQTTALYQFTGLLPTQIQRYGNIDVFSVTRYADGVINTYMVDKSGRIIPLAEGFDLRSLKNSNALLGQAPKALASPISTGTPVYLILPDSSEHLIFLQQILLDGTYASRTDRWQIQVDYAFSSGGEYKEAQALKLFSH